MAQNQLLVSRARSAVLARDFTLAARLYKQLLRDDRDNTELLNQLGEMYMKAGDDTQALSVFKRISELDKGNSRPLITIGGIYRRLKDYENSIAALEQALVLDGSNALISYNLGFTYKSMGDLENAISCFEETVEMNPQDVLAYNHLGAIYAEKGEHEKAVQSYLRGLNVDANHPILLLNIAKSYEALGEYEKACSSYSGALRSRPLWIEAIDGYARLLISLHKAEEAFAMVNRAIAVNPKDQKLKDALENIRQYMKKDEGEEPVSAKADEKVIEEVPSLFEGLGAVDNEEFDSHGLEINMEEDDFAAIEDEALMPTEEEINAGTMSGNDDDSATPFDFDAMGMDDLAGDGPLDPMFFEHHENSDPEQEIDSMRNLDSLISNTEAPADTEDEPVSYSPIFDPIDDEIEPEKVEITSLPDGVSADPFSEMDDVFGESEPQTEELPPEEPPVASLDDQQLKELAEDLKDQVAKAQETLDKANYAAEKAWDAAQQAADNAQLADELAKRLGEMEPEAEEEMPVVEEEPAEEEMPVVEEEPAEEEPEMAEEPETEEESVDEEPVEDEMPEELAEEEIPEEEPAEEEPVEEPAVEETEEAEPAEEELPEEAEMSAGEPDTEDVLAAADQALSDAAALASNPELSLFLKLRELLNYLPANKKEEFMESRARIKLDYVISRLSGQQGFFEKASEIAGPQEVQDENEGLSRDLLEKGLNVMKDFASALPDDSLREALSRQLDNIVV